jgi:hypothetical protein
MVQRRETRRLARRVAIALLAVGPCRCHGVEERALGIESRQPIFSVRGRPLADGITPITDQDHVDANDVGQLTRFAALGAPSAQ